MLAKKTQTDRLLYVTDDHHYFPQLSVVCPLCESEMEVSAGLNAADTLWMHEHECREQLLGTDFAPSWRENAA